MENRETKKGGAKNFFKMLYKLRGVFLSLPIAVVAVFMALNSLRILPEQVGFFVQADGQFQYFVSRDLAILVPAAVTLICIVITSLSKKVIYPWLISLFSLVLPLILWFTNAFGM